MAYHLKVPIQNDDDNFHPNDIDNYPALVRVAKQDYFGTWECIWVGASVIPAVCSGHSESEQLQIESNILSADGFRSSLAVSTFGVPQGSILVPILFSESVS